MEMSDTVTFDDFDRHMRAAGERVAHEARLRPIPAAPCKPPSPWRMPLAVTAVLAFLVGGLVLIGTNRNDADPADTPPDPRWLVGELPTGWALAATLGPAEAEAADPGPEMSVYANAPGEMVMVPYAGEWDEDPAAEVIGGRQVTRQGGVNPLAKTTLFDLGDGTAVGALTVGMGDAQIDAVLETATIGPTGSVAIDEARLPPGLRRLSSRGEQALNLLSTGYTDSLPADVAVASYGRAGTLNDFAQLSIAPADPAVEVVAPLVGDTRPAPEIGGIWVESDQSVMLVWTRGRLTFVLASLSISGEGVSTGDMIAMAQSVRPASADEWAAVRREPTASPDTTSPTYESVPDESTVAEDGPVKSQPVRTLPDGRTWELRFARDGGVDWVRLFVDGEVVAAVRERPGGSAIDYMRTDDGLLAVFAVLPEGFGGTIDIDWSSGNASQPATAPLAGWVVPDGEFEGAVVRDDNGNIVFELASDIDDSAPPTTR